MADDDARVLSPSLVPGRLEKPTRSAVRHSIVRPVSQVSFQLLSADGISAFDQARSSVLKWIEQRAGVPLPAGAWEGKSFELEEVGARPVTAVELESPKYWAARLDDLDRTTPQRTWTTEVALGEQSNGTVIFGARLISVTRGFDPPFERSIPGFIRNIVERQKVLLDGHPIGSEPWIIDAYDDVEVLVKLLMNPRRRSDVILFALPEGSNDVSQTSASPFAVHRRTLGAAHVAIITGPASYYLSDLVGKEFSVFHRGIRTYLPGFDPSQDQPFAHPLGLPARVVSWPNGGSVAYEHLLETQALRRSVMHADIEQTLPPFSVVSRFAAQVELDSARSAGSSDTDLLALAENEIKQLRASLDDQKTTYDGLLAASEEERIRAERSAAESQSRIGTLRRRIESLERGLGERAGQRDAIDIPTNLENFEDWCARNLAGAVELHNRAYQGAKKSLFQDIPLIYRSLLLLRDKYVPLRRNGGEELLNAYREACGQLGLEESATFSGNRYGEEGDTYFIRYAGQRRLLDRHLKNGNAREPRYCFRLYFFWDEEDEQVVVGWLPSHLDSRLT